MNAYEAKVAARLERLRALAARRRAEGEQLVESGRKMAGVIPFGQPILVGHHSEKTDRNYRARIDRKLSKGFEAIAEARDLERRADAAESNRAISADDPDAIAKLRAKLKELAADRARAIELNALLRTAKRIAAKSGTPFVLVARKALEDMGLTERTITLALEPDCFGNMGVAPFKLTNLGAEIRRLQARIEQLEAAAHATTFDHTIGEVVLSEADNRVRLTFHAKPSDRAIALLKSRGFRWSPTAGAWQRQATESARYAALAIARALAVDVSVTTSHSRDQDHGNS